MTNKFKNISNRDKSYKNKFKQTNNDFILL